MKISRDATCTRCGDTKPNEYYLGKEVALPSGWSVVNVAGLPERNYVLCDVCLSFAIALMSGSDRT